MRNAWVSTRVLGLTVALCALFAAGSGCDSSGDARSGSSGAGAHGGGVAQGGGAPECTPPTAVKDCGASSDCQTISCESGSCKTALAAKNTPCTNADGDEVCDGEGECVPPSCTDGALDGKETDVDCGGGDCGPCINGKLCGAGFDCESGFCAGKQSGSGGAGGNGAGNGGSGGGGPAACAPCGADADCAADAFCDVGLDGGTCLPKKADGESCTATNQCLSGFCPGDDGVCCDTGCDSACEACLATKTGGAKDGECLPVAADSDPDNECTASDADCQTGECGGLAGNCKPAASSVVCRAEDGNCDAAESCDGNAVGCPSDAAASSATVCRAKNGVCDVAENCDGVTRACPNDAVEPSTTECRTMNGVCDVAESCDGAGKACPNDAVASTATECRAKNGVCDVAESCDGASKGCPNDGVATTLAVCRAKNGLCDVAESCDGASKGCPNDGVEPSTTVCRAKATTCDVAESCDGTTKVCPNDATGTSVTYFSDDFSTSAKGWTLGLEWQIGTAKTSSGQTAGFADPATDHSPSNDNGVAGVVIGGNASTLVHGYYWLESPPVNTANATTVVFEYWRWLNSDYTPYMTNKVEVFNGTTWVNLWTSGSNMGIADSQWTKITYDLTAHKNAGLRVRFGFATFSGAFIYSGWNVDDVLISDGTKCL